MAFTQAQLDALEEAIAEGVLTVKYIDKTITYRSLKEMLALREIMRKDLGVTISQPSRTKMEFNKGLEDIDDE